jgi:hypothetical protein
MGNGSIDEPLLALAFNKAVSAWHDDAAPIPSPQVANRIAGSVDEEFRFE